MSALRLARAVTRRDRVIKFAGCYHGHVDALLASAGSGVMTLGIPSTPGVPTGVTADTIVCAFNDVDGVAAACERYGEGLAAIVVEPVAGNMGCVPPEPGFLEALRSLADATGALLVFDEVMTGFRVARGGAQELYGVTPDLTILGKIVGGGLPAAAFGGRGRADGAARPRRRRLPGGHALGEPARHGGRDLRPAPAPRRDASTTSSSGSARGSRPGSRPFGVVQRVGAMLTLFCRETPVRDDRDAAASDTERFGALFRHLLGVGHRPAALPVRVPLPVDRAHGRARRRDRRGRRGVLRHGSASDAVPGDRGGRCRGEPAVGRRAPASGRAPGRAGVLLARRRPAVRARGRDDLRGVPPPLRPCRVSSLPRTTTWRSCSATRSWRTGSCASPSTGSVAAVGDLAELLSLCAQARADGLDGDGAAWAATSALLGQGGLDGARAALRDDRDAAPLERLARATAGDDSVDRALAAHVARLV